MNTVYTEQVADIESWLSTRDHLTADEFDQLCRQTGIFSRREALVCTRDDPWIPDQWDDQQSGLRLLQFMQFHGRVEQIEVGSEIAYRLVRRDVGQVPTP